MSPKPDALYAAATIVLIGFITVLSPFPDFARLCIMGTLSLAAFVAQRIL
jgi:hypothetical protein